MNKQVLILTTPFRPNIGGVETHLDDLIEVGIGRGFKFTVLTYQPLITNAKGKYIERSKGLTVYRIPWLRMNLFLLLEKYPFLEFLYLFPPLFIGGLLLMFKSHSKIKIIHSQGLVAGAVGFFLSKIFMVPFIVSTHSIYNFPKNGLYRYFIKVIFESCTKVLTLSRQSYEEVVGLGVPKENVEVFIYWVDQKTFKYRAKDRARVILNLSKDKFICLFVGRLVEVKGIKELLQATRLSKNKKIVYLIAGDGPLTPIVEAEVIRNSNILFKGKINNKELANFYNAADVLIVPSIHEEGFGRVILEALSSGLPVIASNRGGIKEAITSDVGILIKITPKIIKDTLEQLIRNKKKISAMVYAKIRYSQKNARMILKYYDN